MEKAILETRKHGKPVEADFKLTRPDDTIRWAHITCAMFKNGSDEDVIGGTVMDITDRKQSEAALLQGQKLESLGLLAGGIAHDFNNLLAALRGNLDLAQSKLPGDSQVSTYVAKSEKIIDKAANLTRQLLAYSGKGKFQLKPMDLTLQVKEMGHLLSVSISKKVKLHYDITEGLPAIIGDTSQIQQVVMNLVINASEAIGDPGGFVQIRTGLKTLGDTDPGGLYTGQGLVPGPYVFLEVQDNGHGMDTRTLERIFDPFFTTKFHGRGLGLAAMLGIVKGHKGGITVDSEVGRGTTFRILFPSTGTAPEKPSPATLGNGYRGSDILEHLGFEVVLAADGQEGLERVQEHRGALRMILLDLTMPRMNGIQCLRALRAVDPLVPVLMTSGFSETECTVELAGLSLSGFLQKPYSLASLKTKMREILG
jgi:signal transduction histidine kinase/CheY-like chemotaxis protein